MTGIPLEASRPRRRPILWAAWCWAALAAFFVVLSAFALFYDHFPADERIEHAIQNIDVPVLGGYFDFINLVGNGYSLVIVAVVLSVTFAVRRIGWEAVLLPLALIPRAANSAMKDLIDRPRPSADYVDITGHATGPGFPSGHTVGTAALYGLLFFLIPAAVPFRPLRWLLQAGCLLAVASAGPARVYVGVHWPSDVLAGYLLAALFVAPLAAAYLLASRGRRRPRPEPTPDSLPS